MLVVVAEKPRFQIILAMFQNGRKYQNQLNKHGHLPWQSWRNNKIEEYIASCGQQENRPKVETDRCLKILSLLVAMRTLGTENPWPQEKWNECEKDNMMLSSHLLLWQTAHFRCPFLMWLWEDLSLVWGPWQLPEVVLGIWTCRSQAFPRLAH